MSSSYLSFLQEKDLFNCNSPIVPYTCETCSETTYERIQFLKHRCGTKFYSTLEIICENCKTYGCFSKYYKQRHALRCEALPIVPPKINQWYECDQCHFKSGLEMTFKNHKIQKHPLKQYNDRHYCIKCSHKAETLRDLKFHMFNKHPVYDEFKCDQCNFGTFTNFHLQEHRSFMHNSLNIHDWFCCQYCDFRAKSLTALKTHTTKTHMIGRLKFECDQCNFVTTKNVYLIKHQLSVHTTSEQQIQPSTSKK